MNELEVFAQELKDFIIDRLSDVETGNKEIAANREKTPSESRMAELRDEVKQLEGEIKGMPKEEISMNQ